MSTILLTGAAGLISAETAQILAEHRHIIVGLDNFNQTPDELIQPGTQSEDQIVLNNIFNELTPNQKTELNLIYLPNRIYSARIWMWDQLKKDGLWSEMKVLHARGLTSKLISFFLKLKHKLVQS